MNKKTIELEAKNIELVRKVEELEAQLAHRYYYAQQGIDKASSEHMMGGGVILTLTALGGREIVEPVCIKDGLSAETIVALKRDLYRSFDEAIAWKPKKVDAALSQSKKDSL